MTNREKYIDNASNRDLAELLLDAGIYGGRKCNYSKKVIDNIVDDIEDFNSIKVIETWLSQEVEEDKIINAEEIRKKAKTDTNYGFLLQEILMLEKRIEKLEKKYDYKWENGKEKSADEMFEELGYKKDKQVGSMITYHKKVDNGIKEIAVMSFGALYCSGFIIEREDKAIHKKIEELKNGSITN